MKDGSLEENKHKNRVPDVIPGESDRPYLSTQAVGCNNYINAVYVDSFRKHNCYIVTQMPLPETQVDLWRLVYDHHIKYIIMLNELDVLDENKGQLSSPGPVNVRHLQLLNWPNKDVFPPDNTSFLSLLEEIHNWQEQQKDSQNPKINDKMIIHCM
ncbi:hypothetical protein LSH36_1206g00049 [Paralvinella palmiformis]|uniref:Tyrosine-protein phosphatase domain-containing protein n=1 Tax=Paralvinella palmiformis TaxID=53620 RepID=A0AAD9IVA1_9ANNE|nr:hypothetical protein LSH36_1206g00049 [Paralvinella palmiformis]